MAIFHIKLIQLPVGFSLGIRHVGVSFLDPSRLACSTNSGLSWKGAAKLSRKISGRIRHNVDFLGRNGIEHDRINKRCFFEHEECGVTLLPSGNLT